MKILPFLFTVVALDDVDQYQEWANGQEWKLKSRQLSRGPNQIKFDQLALPSLFVGHHHVKQVLHDVFDVPSGHVVFAICRAKLPAVWCGFSIPPTVLSVYLTTAKIMAKMLACCGSKSLSVGVEIPHGEITISLKHTMKEAELNGPSTVELFINKKKVSEVDIKATASGAFTAHETFDFGRDEGMPVIREYEDKGKFKFTEG